MKVLFFDGYCSLCNHFIDRMLRWDKRGHLKFSSLQGQSAKKYLSENQLPQHSDPTTIIYFRDGHIYSQSTAVLYSLIDLGGFWKLSQILFLIPTWLRDFIYQFVAKNRYRIFGRRDTCRLPTTEESHHFLP